MKLEDTLSKLHIDLAVNNLSEEQQLLAPVKNTFVHFDDVPCAPPSELIRLHTCPAEVGMSYFFEKIGCSPNSRAVGSTCVVPLPSKMLERSCSAVKSVSWAPTGQEGLMEEVKHTEEKKEPEEEKEPVAADAELGEFFTVKKGKKQRHAGARLAAQPKQSAAAIVEASAIVDHAAIAQPVQTERPALEDEKRSSSEVLAASALEPTSATEGKSRRPSLDADLEETTKEESTSVMSSAPVKARPRWVDLEETDVDEEAAARPAAAPAAKPAASGRPTFSRPGREARVRHSKADAAEICALEFDTVDASSQSGLVGRMLVMLKSLAQPVVFWAKAEQAGAEEEKREEEKFRLLGLEEDDMYAIGRFIRKADKKISDRQFREAFNEMCEARRWLQNDQEWAEAQRARRAEKEAVREPKTREAPRTKKNEVKEQAAAAAAPEVEDDDVDEWQTVGGGAAAEKKKRTAAPEKTGTSSFYAAGTPAPRAAAAGTTTKGPRRWCAEGQPSAAWPQPARQAAAVAPPPPAVDRRRYPAAASTSAVGVGQQPSRGEGTKFLCRFAVGIEAEVKGGFRVCRRIFGPGGENMKSIARETNAKLRLRGRGSGFKEGPELREADEPLVLCVSAEAREGYRKAVESVSALFERIYQDYKAHCEKHRLPTDPQLAVRLQEHPGNPHC